jgi:hypothetical protein
VFVPNFKTVSLCSSAWADKYELNLKHGDSKDIRNVDNMVYINTVPQPERIHTVTNIPIRIANTGVI